MEIVSRRWMQVIGLVAMLSLCMSSSAFAEEESRLEEILDVLNTISQNLKDGNYGAASGDFDYVYDIFKEQKGTWLLGCFVKKFQKWTRVGEGKREVVGAAALGGGTTITQGFVRDGSQVDAKIVMSPMASGLGALLSNPAFRGGGKGKQKRLRNGLTVNVQPKEISGVAGGAMLSWKVVKGAVSSSDFEKVAGGTVNVGCVKDLVGGQ
ncbi:MAG: hypothetical protein ACPGYT_10395 [Nitrospirales bacterium]